MKKIFSSLLVLFALLGVGMALRNQISQETRAGDTATEPTVARGVEDAALASDPENETAAPTDAVAAANRVVVTYFTGDARCPSCYQIENMTRQTVETRYADELAAGRVEFRIINVNRAENKHYIQDYKLVSKTVIVSKLADGEEVNWENLQDVWRLFGNRAAFEAYLSAAINTRT